MGVGGRRSAEGASRSPHVLIDTDGRPVALSVCTSTCAVKILYVHTCEYIHIYILIYIQIYTHIPNAFTLCPLYSVLYRWSSAQFWNASSLFRVQIYHIASWYNIIYTGRLRYTYSPKKASTFWYNRNKDMSIINQYIYIYIYIFIILYIASGLQMAGVIETRFVRVSSKMATFSAR